MKDKMGREIKVGDFVAYAQRQSSSLWVNIGKVLKVAPDKIQIRAVEENYQGQLTILSRNSALSCSNRIVVVEPTEEYRELLKDFIPQLTFGQALEVAGFKPVSVSEKLELE